MSVLTVQCIQRTLTLFFLSILVQLLAAWGLGEGELSRRGMERDGITRSIEAVLNCKVQNRERKKKKKFLGAPFTLQPLLLISNGNDVVAVVVVVIIVIIRIGPICIEERSR